MIDLTITEAPKKLKSREISATELTRAHLARIEKYNPELNAYITVTAERALTDAVAAGGCGNRWWHSRCDSGERTGQVRR